MDTRDGGRKACPEGSRREARRPNVLLLSGGILVLAVLAMACHKEGFHLGSMHPGAQTTEEYCTDSDATGISDAAVNDAVTFAISAQARNDTWETIGGVHFVNRGDCDNYSLSELEDIELRYQVQDAPGACAGEVACAVRSSFNCSNHQDSNHDNCAYFDIYMARFLFELGPGTRRHVFNHETGHALSLKDPLCVADPVTRERDGGDICGRTKTGEYCKLRINGVFNLDLFAPIVSVMHNDGYCCPDLERHRNDGTSCRDHWPGDFQFPTHYDRVMVQLIAHNNPLVR